MAVRTTMLHLHPIQTCTCTCTDIYVYLHMEESTLWLLFSCKGMRISSLRVNYGVARLRPTHTGPDKVVGPGVCPPTSHDSSWTHKLGNRMHMQAKKEREQHVGQAKGKIPAIGPTRLSGPVWAVRSRTTPSRTHKLEDRMRMQATNKKTSNMLAQPRSTSPHVARQGCWARFVEFGPFFTLNRIFLSFVCKRVRFSSL